ncbi:MAG TPA: glycoside hydrolase family 2 TIM barrel-domain containing protein [Bacteroidales bacterium]|nr:glycoside hydrolase family 2 TIM barrel-domain containing protein [Bacteroidales bacterium]
MKKILCILFTVTAIMFRSYSQPSIILLNENWKARRATDILADGNEISSGNYKIEGWIDAVVPGTVLTTLLHNNQIPDPFFGMNNNLIPDVFETGRDYYTYWFYNEFDLPELNEDQQVWISFRGINYFADVFLNGKRVNTDTHEGMYLREKYLITPFLNKGKPNKIAVWVAPPDPVGNPNGGQGGDGTIGRNVTMQFTAGWDWICPVRDRNTGIWDQVAIEITGTADLRNPFVEMRVPGIREPGAKQQPVFLKPSAELVNPTSTAVQGTLSVSIEGETKSVKVTLNPYEVKIAGLPEFKIQNPRLWWPNGMGDQPLYKVKFDFVVQSGVNMDSEEVTIGIREAANYWDEKIRSRVFTVNGQKVFIKGGNWIASDMLMRLSAERYDAEVRMHAGMNMNMIRVWGGGLTERPEFYNACDKYGVLVWQDLWISGDCNGEWLDPMKKESQARRKAYPDNHDLFLESAVDQIKMLRNHPSLYLWCGSNETLPVADILKSLEEEIFPKYDPGRYFLEYSTSAKLMTNSIGGVGDGPYGIREPEKIFTERSFPFNPETGSIGIPNYDGLVKFIPQEELKPPQGPRPGRSWQYHKYLPLMDFPDRYGKVKDIQDFCFKAQIVSYEQYRALQEAFNHKMWDWYAGMLVWKNQNPWTALRGSFYDYYLDYQGGYFGFKHGAAPVHIQLNLNDSVVCVLNQKAVKTNPLTAGIMLYDMHGKLLSEKKNDVTLQAHTLQLLDKVVLPANTNEVFFLKLQLSDQDKIVDENLYWLSNKTHSYEKLNELQKVTLNTDLRKIDNGQSVIRLSNPGSETAFFIRLKVTNGKNELILPVWFTENFLTLLPGEEKEIMVDLSTGKSTTGMNDLKLVIEGWNVPVAEFQL